MPSARSIGVGAFVLGGVLLFTAALFLIGERRMLFSPKVELYTEFAAVAGLQPGAEVRVAGMTAGEVTDITAPSSPAGRFRVGLEIRRDLQPLVRTDSVASIRTEGLVGSQFLQVSIGSEGAPEAPAGSVIPGREPFDMVDLLEQARGTVGTIGDLVAGLRVDIADVLRVLATAGTDADAIVRDVGVEVRKIAETGDRIATETEAIVRGVREGRGTLGKIVTDDELYQRATAMAADAETAVRNLREATTQATEAIQALTGRGGAVQGLSGNVRESLARANAALTNIEETAEALKHNWFFRGYFQRRGYFSLSDISAAEYRQGILEENNRVPLRIWLKAELVFERTADGFLIVSPGGAARLDSAMTEYLDFTGPIMVEGYATEGSAAERVVLSRERGEAARVYLIRRFALDPTNIGAIPLGSTAPGSPGDGTWDGVSLTIFVERAALRPSKR